MKDYTVMVKRYGFITVEAEDEEDALEQRFLMTKRQEISLRVHRKICGYINLSLNL